MAPMAGFIDAAFHSDERGLYTRLHRDQTVERARALRAKYAFLFDARDRELRESHMCVFARYDLYTKDPLDGSSAHLDEYRALLDRHFPEPLDW